MGFVICHLGFGICPPIHPPCLSRQRRREGRRGTAGSGSRGVEYGPGAGGAGAEMLEELFLTIKGHAPLDIEGHLLRRRAGDGFLHHRLRLCIQCGLKRSPQPVVLEGSLSAAWAALDVAAQLACRFYFLAVEEPGEQFPIGTFHGLFPSMINRRIIPPFYSSKSAIFFMPLWASIRWIFARALRSNLPTSFPVVPMSAAISA